MGKLPTRITIPIFLLLLLLLGLFAAQFKIAESTQIITVTLGLIVFVVRQLVKSA